MALARVDLSCTVVSSSGVRLVPSRRKWRSPGWGSICTVVSSSGVRLVPSRRDGARPGGV
jgi:hypothetical protein